MRRNSIYILVAVIVMMGILMMSLASENRKSRPQATAFMLPGLKANLAYVSQVNLTSGDQSVTLIKLGSQWVVRERSQYEVDFKKFSSFINSLADAKLLEKKTKKPENFDRLGVSETNSKATQVTVLVGEDRFSFVSGALASDAASPNGQGSQRKGRFIRITDQLADTNQVWLTDIGWSISAEPMSWLDRSLLDIDANQVVRVSIQHPNEVLNVSRRGGEWHIDNLPEGAELTYPGIASNLSQGLARLRFDDVRLASEIDFDQATLVTFELEPSAVLSKEPSAVLDKEPSATLNNKPSAEGANLIRLKAVSSDSKFWLTITDSPDKKNTGEWAYQIDQITYANLTKHLSDLLRPELPNEVSSSG